MSTVPSSVLPKRSDYTTKTRLRLPFRGQWYTSWGGRHACENIHLGYNRRPLAYDFVVRRNGRTYRGDGDENEDYYCFGKDNLAPAAGRVVVAVDTVKDNTPPGKIESQTSNRVVIDHGNGEYSVLVHLRYGSVPVEEGEWVERGEKIGECGNSGTSTMPHLHYELVSDPGPEEGEPLPALFVDYYAGDDHIRRDMPKRGQYVRDDPR